MFDHQMKCVIVFLVCVLFVAVSVFPAVGAEIHVTESLDEIPAPEGSLRWALEKSESNGEPDTIIFLIDVDRIFLVAPLPSLVEGSTSIGRTIDSDETGVAGVPLTLDGDGIVEYAFEIISADNTIAELGFERFTGREIIRLLGEAAIGNEITSCSFLAGAGAGIEPQAGIRLAEGDPDHPGVPSRTTIRRNSFYGFDRAIDIRPSVISVPPIAPTAWIRNNQFGPETPGDPGTGNSYGVYSSGTSGALVVRNNVFNGPGITAIKLDDGAETNTIHRNRLGHRSKDGTACRGFSGPGIELSRMPQASVDSNRIDCTDTGISVDRSSGLFINQNHLDATFAAVGTPTVAIDLSDSTGTIRNNTIVGFTEGIRAAVPEGSGDLIYSCNRIGGEALIDPIVETNILTEPPVLEFSNLLNVRGTVLDAGHGWVEIYGSNDGIAASAFQGASDAGGFNPEFTHRLPVLNLRAEGGAGVAATRLSFDAEDPPEHRGLRTRLDVSDSSPLSPGFPAEPTPIVYDMVRGHVLELGETGDGNVTLGLVECIARGVVAADLPIIDDARPLQGEAFFYVVRKRLEVEAGTYNAATCGTELDRIIGERLAMDGDCL